ncbi:MAG TPA: nucleotidyltransferase domain-containing protein, partial [Casimicrobiaceae bacterium]|nr:nucleotidyltransferase domain-containing protein [Casimicrobiaceae bacterium]
MSFAPGAAADSRPPSPVAEPRVDHWRELLREGRARLREEFFAAGDTPRLLRGLSRLTDEVVAGVWAEGPCRGHCALVAVGGYGRGQLYPHSDVDVLILLPPESGDDAAAAIERLLASLWDIGVELSHAVRTVAECVAEMATDTTIRTSLLEHRQLAGSPSLYDEFRKEFAASLDVRAFYAAKTLEQQRASRTVDEAAVRLPAARQVEGRRLERAVAIRLPLV